MENFSLKSVQSIYKTELIDTSIKLSSDSKEFYAYSVYLKLNKEKTLLFSKENKKYCNSKIKININDYPLEEDEYAESIKSENTISITFTIPFVSMDKKMNFICYEDFKAYLDLFFDNITIGDLVNVKNKINYEVLTSDTDDVSSSIFSVNSREEIELYSIFKNERLYRNQKIIGVIEAVPKAIREEKKAEIIEGFFSILSDRIIEKNNFKEFIISLGNSSYIANEDIKTSEKTVDILLEIQKFIFRSSEKYYDRLNIFKNILSEKIENNFDIDDDTLNKILEDSKLHYKLFIGDKIKKFIQEKKKVTEDYLKFNERITKSISSVTEDLPKHLLTTIGIVITTFFLKGIDNDVQIWVVPLFALIYFGFYVFFKCKKGWHFETNNFKEQEKLMNESYQELYTLDQEFIEKLKEDYLDPKLAELKRMESLTKKITFFILALIFCWFLWA